MLKLTSEQLRTWQWCPLQSRLCTLNAVQPLMEASRSCMSQALAEVAPKKGQPKFASNKLGRAFDAAWTKYQTDTQAMTTETFIGLGQKMVGRCQLLADLINQAIDGGWSFVDSAVDIWMDLGELDPDLQGVTVSHRIDCFLRDPTGLLAPASYATSSTVSYAKLREINHSLDIQLSNMIGRHRIEEEIQPVLISLTQKRILKARLPVEADRSVLGLIRDTYRSIISNTAPRRTVSELSCGFCPVQGLCDDPSVYNIIHEKELKL